MTNVSHTLPAAPLPPEVPLLPQTARSLRALPNGGWSGQHTASMPNDPPTPSDITTRPYTNGRQTDRRTDRQAGRQRQAGTDRDRQRQTETDRDRQRQTERETETDRETEGDGQRQIETETEAEQRQTETDRDRDADRDRDGGDRYRDRQAATQTDRQRKMHAHWKDPNASPSITQGVNGRARGLRDRKIDRLTDGWIDR